MFKKDQLSVGDWLLYYILMAVPLVNIIIWIMVLGDKENNETLRNMEKLSLIGILICVAIVALAWGTLLPIIENYLPSF